MGATHECVYEGGACISRLDWKDGAIPAVSFSARAALSGAFLRLNALSALPNVKKLLEQNKMPVTGKASLNFVADIYGTGKIGIDVGTILGFRIGFIGARYNSEPIASFNKEIVKPYTVF
ncbi:MAG: hypothetical protein LBF60_00550 [Treponema sp.]|nr:hypothetical protein [Treponema sp.]